jgi:hypothetical protein
MYSLGACNVAKTFPSWSLTIIQIPIFPSALLTFILVNLQVTHSGCRPFFMGRYIFLFNMQSSIVNFEFLDGCHSFLNNMSRMAELLKKITIFFLLRCKFLTTIVNRANSSSPNLSYSSSIVLINSSFSMLLFCIFLDIFEIQEANDSLQIFCRG